MRCSTTCRNDRDEVERALAVALTDPEVADAARAGRLERIPDTAGGFATFGDALGDALAGCSVDDADRVGAPRAKPSAAETRRLARLAALDVEERAPTTSSRAHAPR